MEVAAGGSVRMLRPLKGGTCRGKRQRGLREDLQRALPPELSRVLTPGQSELVKGKTFLPQLILQFLIWVPPSLTLPGKGPVCVSRGRAFVFMYGEVAFL